MTTKTERNLEEELGPSPNPLFAKRDEPWKDHELMLKLQDQHQYQYEIAHVLGCSESKVSYWMQKAEENWAPEVNEEEHECCFFEVCGFKTHTEDGICPTCLDLVRENDSAPSPRHPSESDNMTEHIAALYETYDYETNTP